MSSFLSYLWYELTYVLGANYLTLFHSMRIEGRENMPKDGPALVLANHQSFMDPVLVGTAVRRHLTYLARKTLFRNKFFTTLIRSLNAVPIDQDGVGKEGIRTIIEQLKAGRAVLVFPEGSRTPDGAMHPLKPGVHLLMKRAHSAIVPVGIAGAYDAWPIWRKYPTVAPIFYPRAAGTIAVVVGRPMDSSRFAALPREQSLQELFHEISKVQARAEQIRRKK